MLKVIPLAGTVVTGDAAFCQRDLCEPVIAGGGDHVVTVKANRPALRERSTRHSPRSMRRSRTTTDHRPPGGGPSRAAEGNGVQRTHTGIEHPIIAAPMGPDLTGPDLVAAVRNAG